MIRFIIDEPRPLEGAARILADLCKALLPRFEALPEVKAYDIPGRDIEIKVVLGGEEECHDWDVEADSLGFQAVASGLRTDDETGDEYRELADHFVAYINLDAAIHHLGRDWERMDAFDRELALEPWLVTGPHEYLHILEWITQTQGKTPGEVFDAGGEAALHAVHEGIDVRLAGEGGDAEDAIEIKARRLTDRIMAGLVEDAVKALGDRLSPSPPRPN